MDFVTDSGYMATPPNYTAKFSMLVVPISIYAGYILSLSLCNLSIES